MQFDLSPENLQFLQDQVGAGEFATGTEALNAAVDALKRQADMRAKVRRGLQQLDNGQYVELDEEGMDHFFQDLFSIASGDGSPK